MSLLHSFTAHDCARVARETRSSISRCAQRGRVAIESFIHDEVGRCGCTATRADVLKAIAIEQRGKLRRPLLEDGRSDSPISVGEDARQNDRFGFSERSRLKSRYSLVERSRECSERTSAQRDGRVR